MFRFAKAVQNDMIPLNLLKQTMCTFALSNNEMAKQHPNWRTFICLVQFFELFSKPTKTVNLAPFSTRPASVGQLTQMVSVDCFKIEVKPFFSTPIFCWNYFSTRFLLLQIDKNECMNQPITPQIYEPSQCAFWLFHNHNDIRFDFLIIAITL